MSDRSGWLSIFARRAADAGTKPLPGPITAKPRSDLADTASITAKPADKPAPITVESLAAALKATVSRPCLVFAVDATSSRQAAWNTAKRLTDKLLGALPGELNVALAVHGGSRVHTFTEFVSDPEILRQVAGRVRCIAGYTRLLPILDRVARTDNVRVVVYIGDVFEESEGRALRLADTLLAKDIRVIILHDQDSRDHDAGEIFRAIAERTGGAVLPFDASAIEALGELLQAVAVLAVGGPELVEAKKDTLPAATLLLENLSDRKLIGRR
jgi:hypothetical protein